MDAVKRADSLDSDKLREIVLKLKSQTVIGDFAVDERLSGRSQSHHHPVAGWQVGSGLARRSGHEQASVPNPAVEPAKRGFLTLPSPRGRAYKGRFF